MVDQILFRMNISHVRLRIGHPRVSILLRNTFLAFRKTAIFFGTFFLDEIIFDVSLQKPQEISSNFSASILISKMCHGETMVFLGCGHPLAKMFIGILGKKGSLHQTWQCHGKSPNEMTVFRMETSNLAGELPVLARWVHFHRDSNTVRISIMGISTWPNYQ